MNGKGLIIAIVGVGVGLGGMMQHGFSRINSDIRSMQDDITDLRERMARLEGLFEGHLNREVE